LLVLPQSYDQYVPDPSSELGVKLVFARKVAEDPLAFGDTEEMMTTAQKLTFFDPVKRRAN
jgi:hypothetical protein